MNIHNDDRLARRWVFVLAHTGTLGLQRPGESGLVAINLHNHLTKVVVIVLQALAGQYATLIQDHHVIANKFDIFKNVGAEHHTDAHAVINTLHQLQHFIPALRVHTGGGLIQENQLGIMHYRLRQLHALPHTGAESLDKSIALFAESYLLQYIGSPLPRLAGR